MPTLSRIDFAPDLTEQVYERLLEAICSAELPPEARLTQQELAKTLNVSRQPVLQALRMLRKDGFVIDAGRRGLMVAPLNPRVIEQTYQVRAVLDGLAAREAASRKAHLPEKLIAEGRTAASSCRIASMIEADLKFHQALYDASGNPLITEAANHHWQHIRRAMGAVLMQSDIRETVWDEHAGIADAVNVGDALLAEKLARAHGEDAGRAVAGELDRHMQRAS
ncbi:MAG: FCD domain-containing protein [Burkholderiales bacterium]|nr:FCD domain-containing protein [Burkholderiales bacterium]